jgi:hypothetical protein
MVHVAVHDRRHGQRPEKAPSAWGKGEFMFRQNRTSVLVDKIDDAIEHAEDLGLAFVAGILMMARLEAMQTDLMTCARRADDEHQ